MGNYFLFLKKEKKSLLLSFSSVPPSGEICRLASFFPETQKMWSCGVGGGGRKGTFFRGAKISQWLTLFLFPLLPSKKPPTRKQDLKGLLK